MIGLCPQKPPLHFFSKMKGSPYKILKRSSIFHCHPYFYVLSLGLKGGVYSMGFSFKSIYSFLSLIYSPMKKIKPWAYKLSPGLGGEKERARLFSWED
jgi:hypothetical protein